MDGASTKKKDLLEIYYKARKETLTTNIMHECFETAGLAPFNPELVILRDEVKKRPRTSTPEPITSLFNTPAHVHEVPQYLTQLATRADLDVVVDNQRTKRVCLKNQ
jgi:hypothetical protein